MNLRDLLADLNRLADEHYDERLMVLPTDDRGLGYLRDQSIELFVVGVGNRGRITTEAVHMLPQTAWDRATKRSEWTPLEVELLWRREITDWTLLVWRVERQAK